MSDNDVILRQLFNGYWRTRTDAWPSHQELRVDDLSTLRRLAPEAPRGDDDTLPQRFFGFPVIVDDTLPRNRIHLVDRDGDIVKAWTVADP